MARKKKYWLAKSEPEVYSIADLRRDKKTMWEGVRNYQARNFLRDEIKVGDEVFFYHSRAEPPGIAGIARVCRAGYPDPTAFDRRSKYYDAKSDKENPRWFVVDLRFVKKIDPLIALAELKANPALAEMAVVQRGMRLSVQPVTDDQWRAVLKMRPRK